MIFLKKKGGRERQDIERRGREKIKEKEKERKGKEKGKSGREGQEKV